MSAIDSNQVNAPFVLKWARLGLPIYLSSFFWSPSRDGLQVVYLLAFFLPMLHVLLSQRPKFSEYGGWVTYSALIYAGFSALSTLWGNPADFGYFFFQWIVLAVWLCGCCFLLKQFAFDLNRFLFWFIVSGAVISLISILYYYYFVFGSTSDDKRLWGWNIFRNPNEIGAMCGILVLMAYVFALRSKTLAMAWMFYAIALIPMAGLILSFSRGALLSLCITALLALIIIRPPLRIWMPPVLVSLFVLAIFINVTDLSNYYLDGRSGGLGGRSAIWKVVFASIGEHTLVGVGMAKNSGILVPDIDVFNHAHSAWLDTLYRTGAVGLFLFLLHLKVVAEKFKAHSQLVPLYLWLLYGCVYNIFDGRSFFWDMGAKWFLCWIPIALIAALHIKDNVDYKNRDCS